VPVGEPDRLSSNEVTVALENVPVQPVVASQLAPPGSRTTKVNLVNGCLLPALRTSELSKPIDEVLKLKVNLPPPPLEGDDSIKNRTEDTE
jgi:hypothetical protein